MDKINIPLFRNYFAESIYREYNISKPIIMNSEGKVINILPLIKSKHKTKKSWHCSSLCKIEKNIINDMKCYFEEFLNCTLQTLRKKIL